MLPIQIPIWWLTIKTIYFSSNSIFSPVSVSQNLLLQPGAGDFAPSAMSSLSWAWSVGAWYVVDYAKSGRSSCKEFRLGWRFSAWKTGGWRRGLVDFADKESKKHMESSMGFHQGKYRGLKDILLWRIVIRWWFNGDLAVIFLETKNVFSSDTSNQTGSIPGLTLYWLQVFTKWDDWRFCSSEAVNGRGDCWE